MALGELAEGEELGSNLLRVAQSSLEDPGGLGPLEKGPAHPTPPVRPEMAVPVHSLPRLAASQTADPRSPRQRPTSRHAPVERPD